MRKIIHIDMDAFFASIEQRDQPEIRHKPVAVGGGGPRGVVASASYEARNQGVRSAMPGSRAKVLCPQLIFVKPRFSVYKEVSNMIRAIFFNYTDLVEPLSLDEAYLDVTENKAGITSALKIAHLIKADIFEATRLTASAGIATNKFLAKVASGMNKPNGCTFIAPEKADQFIAGLPIEKFYGVGAATAIKMKQLGIHNGFDLRQHDKVALIKQFGKQGHYFFDIARGIDQRAVQPDHPRKSFSIERTFSEDISDLHKLTSVLQELADKLGHQAEKSGFFGYTVNIKLRFADFSTITRQKSTQYPLQASAGFCPLALELLTALQLSQPVRLLGIGLSNPPAEMATQMEFPF